MVTHRYTHYHRHSQPQLLHLLIGERSVWQAKRNKIIGERAKRARHSQV